MKQASILLWAILFLGSMNSGLAQGSAFTYQGRLGDGPNAANGSYDLQFTIYDAVSSGSVVAGPIAVAPTTVTGGLFTVTLDFGAGSFNGANRWLQVGVRTNGSVAAYQLLNPRQPLTSTPYAVRAANATSFSGAITDGQLSGNIARLNSNQTFSGTINFINQSNNYTGSFSGNGAGMTNVSVPLAGVRSGVAVTWPGNFTPASAPGVTNVSRSVAVTEVNGDGKQDLVVANTGLNSDGTTLSLFTNNGYGSFAFSTFLTVGTAPISVIATDVNGDGRRDLVSANASSQNLSIFTNNGTGGITPSSTVAVSGLLRQVLAADLNGDNKADLVVRREGNQNLSVLTNNGSGGFAVASTPAVGSSSPRWLDSADVNGDGKVDLVSANDDAGVSLRVLTNAGNATFAAAFSTSLSNNCFSVAAGELNGDGKIDLAVGHQDGLAVLTNNGSGGFAVSKTLATGFPYSVVTADFNADGKLDLAAGIFGPFEVLVLTNNGSGDFSTAASPAVGDFPQQVVAGDVNGDGGVDLVSINYDQTLSVLLNTPAFAGSGEGLVNVPGALPVQLVAGTSFSAQPNISYDATNTALVTATLPVTANIGDIVQINGIGNGGWQVATASGQAINGFSAGAVWTAQPGAPSVPYYSLASSADGTRLVVGTFNFTLYTSTNSGTNWVLQPGAPGVDWVSRQALASSADGLKLVAAPINGDIYTSINGGVSWTARSLVRRWASVASSDDGGKLVAVEADDGTDDSNPGQIYTSTNSGTTWTAQPVSNHWVSVASSADGTKLVALANTIFTSTDSGVTWIDRGNFQFWRAVASSADGTRLVAVIDNGQIFTSWDSGLTWTARPYVANWVSVTCSSDGTKMVAAATGVSGGLIYFSLDGGVTWKPSNAPVARWQCVRSSADGTKLVAGTDGGFGAGQIFTSTQIPFAGGQGTSATLQYAGNGVWQPLNVPSRTGVPNTIVARDANGMIAVGGISISGNNALEFGAGVAGKEASAGKIAYQRFTADALDIVGAGTSGANRKLRFWAEGGSIFAGAVNATSFTGAGSNLTSLNASQLNSGTVADARLSPNVPLLSGGKLNDSVFSTNVAVRTGGNNFSGPQNFTGGDLSMDLGQYWLVKGTNGFHDGLLVRWFDDATYFTYGTGGLIIRNSADAHNFYIHNNGNVGIGTKTPTNKLHVAGGVSATAFTQTSDRNAKENFAPVSPQEVLNKVAALPITTWNFKELADGRHMGPMAQDFHAAFGLGGGSTTISSMDPDGVALAAIQGLNQKLEQKETEILELKARLEKLEQLFDGKRR